MNVLQQIVGDLDVSKEERRKRAKEDFAFFCSYYLSEAFTYEFAEYQKLIIEIVSTRSVSPAIIEKLKNYIWPEFHGYLKPVKKLAGLLDIEPREHGKTTRMSQAFPLWLALNFGGVFPVIVGVSKERAIDYLSSIKLEIENNERIFEDYGDQIGDVWKANKITLKNGNAIAAMGAGEGIRGIKDKYRRPTHIICDDLLKDKEVESRKSREKLYKWFNRVIMNLGKEAFIIVVNTIMHPDDLPSNLLKEIESGSKPRWAGLRFDCELPNGGSLWPARWPIEDLKEKEKEIGTQSYYVEWRNRPIADEDRKFRREWFKTFSLTDIDWLSLRRVMAVDPATGKSAGDDSAIVVLGKDSNQTFYVLEAKGEKISDMQLISKIIELYLFWKPEFIVFETVTFQEIYKNQLLREALRQGITLPIISVKHTVNKEFRISKLSPLVEAGILMFREGLDRCMDQFENFPKGHDDVPDAVEMAYSALVGKMSAAPSVHSLGIKREALRILRGFSDA